MMMMNLDSNWQQQQQQQQQFSASMDYLTKVLANSPSSNFDGNTINKYCEDNIMDKTLDYFDLVNSENFSLYHQTFNPPSPLPASPMSASCQVPDAFELTPSPTNSTFSEYYDSYDDDESVIDGNILDDILTDNDDIPLSPFSSSG